MEANNDAGLAAHPLARCAMSCVYFQTGDVGLYGEDDLPRLDETPLCSCCPTASGRIVAPLGKEAPNRLQKARLFPAARRRCVALSTAVPLGTKCTCLSGLAGFHVLPGLFRQFAGGEEPAWEQPGATRRCLSQACRLRSNRRPTRKRVSKAPAETAAFSAGRAAFCRLIGPCPAWYERHVH